MKKGLKLVVLSLIVSLLGTIDAYTCTSAIISGKITPDGRPLLWKHRDTGEENNRIEFFKGGKYTFIALVDSPDRGGAAWTGTNSAGFSIMNTASYNIKDDDVKEMDMEGVLMYKALAECKNLADFEKFLNNLPRPMRVEANFGVMDAEGGAAYYEVNNTKWVKVDANDPKIAPNGYLIYTNFSYTGRFNDGMGYIRHQTATEIISRQAPLKNITPHWIFNNLSRSYYHSLMGIDLLKNEFSPERGTGWTIDQDYIPRKSTSASVVIQGVKKGENPEMTTMWTVLGYPPVGVAIPLWEKAGEDQPGMVLMGKSSENAEICDYALTLKRNIFSIARGNGSRYMNLNLVYNSSGNGYMQQLAPIEKVVYGLYKDVIGKWRKNGIDLNELKSINSEMESIVKEAYSKL